VFSSARRGQVEPLPALLALAVFAVGLSLYGGTIAEVTPGAGPAVSDATTHRVVSHLTAGPVVVPDRVEDLDTAVSERYAVSLRADGRTWRWGGRIDDADDSRRIHVLVRTDSGEVPGVLRVGR
jgi:hypothetical protein